MSWNNPIESVKGNVSDILTRATHNGKHCLYYNPAVKISDIKNLDCLADVCRDANRWLDKKLKVSQDFQARLVNINRFSQTLQKIGCVKPLLLQYYSELPYTCATGGTRLLAAEVLPSIQTFPAFISTHSDFKHHFSELVEVIDIDTFRKLSNCPTGEIIMRLNDHDAVTGINWYEIDSPDRSVLVRSEESTVAALLNYLQSQPRKFRFTPQWFAEPIDWSRYFSNYTE